VAARSGAELERVARQIVDDGGRAITVDGDVSNEAVVKALAQRALSEHGRIDILVTAAGAAHFGLTAETKVADWDEMLSVNLRGAMLCCRSVLPTMMAQQSGTIVNIGSGVPSRGPPRGAGYNATKKGPHRLAR